MKKTLVTGGTGFVGANLVRRLLTEGHEVHLLIRPESTLWRLQDILPALHLHTINMLDTDQVTAFITHLRPEWIFHLAVYGAYPFQKEVSAILQTNILGTSNLVQACLQADFEAFINTGASSEYGYKNHPPRETDWLDPNSYYAVAKASASLYCRYVSHAQQKPITTLRLYSVYGAYEEPSRLMPTLIKQGLQGKLPPLVSPDTARDFIYIDDVLDAYLCVAEKGTAVGLGEIFNLGTGVQHTMRETVEVVREVLQIPQEPQWGSMPARIWDASVWVADIQHIRQALDWQPQVDFRAGFVKMVDWFKQHEHLYA